MKKSIISLVTKKVFVSKETTRIEEVAKKLGIILPSNHTAIFESIYAPIEEANNNKIRLAEETVKETLPNLIGSQANLNHLGKGFLLGIILDAWINEDTNDIHIIFTFAKNIYQDEYMAALEAMTENKLSVSFELGSDLDTADNLSDGTTRLNDIEWRGVGVLIGKNPAYKNAKVYEFAETYKQRAIESEKEVLYASEIIKQCDVILSEEESEILSEEEIEFITEILGKLKKKKKKNWMYSENEKVLIEAERWTRKYINSLPNSSFAVIEPDYLNGKTDDKNSRHLPFKDKDGNIDLPHYRNALARMNQIKPITDSISTEELRNKAKKELEKHKKVLETAEQGGNKIMTEEQKKLVSDLRAELRDYIPAETKDEDLLVESKVAEIREVKAKAEQAKVEEKVENKAEEKVVEETKKENVSAETRTLSQEKYTTLTTYKEDGSTEVKALKDCTYTFVDSDGQTQTESISEEVNRIMKYAEEDVTEVKNKLAEAEKQVTELKATVETQGKEIEKYKAEEQARKDAEKQAKISEIKATLTANKYVAEFKDEDYLDEAKIAQAKLLQERDDLKAENNELKKKEKTDVKAEVKEVEKDIDTNHKDEVIIDNPRVIIGKLGKNK